MESLFRDVRHGFRTLAKAPGFTAVLLLTLVLGIGATSAIFSVVEAVLLRPLPYPQAEDIVRIWSIFSERDLPPLEVSEGEIFDYIERSKQLESFGAYIAVNTNLSGDGEPERLLCTYASAGFFRVLGVQPAMGRIFVDEDVPGGPPAVILSHSFWQRRFGADPKILDKTLLLNNRKVPVVGVMPPGFQFPAKTELWQPLHLDPANGAPRGQHYLSLIARRSTGVSLEQAQEEMSTIAGEFVKVYPKQYSARLGWGVHLVPLQEEVIGDSRRSLWMLAAAVGLVLLIACANVANLLLGRAWSRRHEVALRLALGASRGRLLRQFLTESILLTLIGGTLGLLLAHAAITVMLATNPEAVARAEGVGLHPLVLGFTLGLSVLVGILLGLIPAMQARQANLGVVLREEGGRATASGRHQLFRRFLVGSEVALALVLLISAGLLIKSFVRLTQVDPGFQAGNLLTMEIALPRASYAEDHQMAQFYGRLLERIEALPGVRSAAAASFLPMSPGINRSETLGAEGVPFGPSAPEPGWRSIDYRYLTTMGIRLLEGRDLRAGDDAQAPPVVIVDEVVALRLWTAGEAIGRRIKVGPPTEKNKRPWMTVVGVAKEVKQVGLSEKSRGVVYYPLPQRTLGSQYLVVRTSFADPLPITSAIRTEIAAIDPDLPVSDIRTMEQRLANSVSEPRFTMALLIIFAVVAAFLAAVGIYGVVAYSVAQRTHEIGLRQALGAQRSDIFRLVVGQGMKVVMIGAGCGLLAAWWATGGLQTLLYEVTTRDPLIFMTVPLLLIAVGLLANLLPAYRASKLDPARALHHD